MAELDSRLGRSFDKSRTSDNQKGPDFGNPDFEAKHLLPPGVTGGIMVVPDPDTVVSASQEVILPSSG